MNHGITPLPNIHQRDGMASGGGDYIPPAQQLLSGKHTPRETPISGRDYPSDYHTPNRRVSLNGESALAMLQLPSQVDNHVHVIIVEWSSYSSAYILFPIKTTPINTHTPYPPPITTPLLQHFSKHLLPSPRHLIVQWLSKKRKKILNIVEDLLVVLTEVGVLGAVGKVGVGLMEVVDLPRVL